MEEESYINVLNKLLHKVFEYLPLDDQLNMRKVNKNWEAEVRIAMRQNPSLEIKIGDHKSLNDFLLDYIFVFAPPSGPNRLLPLAKVSIKPSMIIERRFDQFGQQHAEYIRNLTIRLEENVHISQFESKSRYLLKYFPNLEKLRLDIDIELCRFGSSNSETLPSAPPLPKLRHFEMACPVSHVELPYSIILNAPALESVSLDMRDATTVHPLTSEFLNKLKDFRMKSLDLTLSLSDHHHDLYPDPDLGNQNTLIGKLMQSELKPQQLIIHLQPIEAQQEEDSDSDSEGMENGDGPTDIAQNLLNNLIAKFCRTGLQKLLLRSYYRNDLQISLLPVTCIKLLNFGIEEYEYFHEGNFGIREHLNRQKKLFKRTYRSENVKTVRPNSPLTSALLPHLKTLMTAAQTDGSWPLRQDNVFLNMNKLVMSSPPWYRLRGSCPTTSVTWPAQFPNLTILDITIQAEHEGFLDPILTQMLNLVEFSLTYLSLDFDFWPRPKSADAIWDKITGGLRPILSKDSPLESIIPDGRVYNVAQENAALLRMSTVPALQNLRKLKILKLRNVPSYVAVAIVHLTAIQKIPSLEILELGTRGNITSPPVYHERFVPAQEWIDVLKIYHGSVLMT